jgi:DNA-binding transcriptional regulator/RsmH inhibitor MraZ
VDSQARRVFGFCDEVMRPFEDIRLSDWARATAGITTTALFVGAGDSVELWSPENATSSGDDNLVALARSAMTRARQPST